MIDFKKFDFHEVVKLPKSYEIYDFTKGYDENRLLAMPYGIGKYNEKRVNMYSGPLYKDQRDIHIGIDIGAPIGTPIHAFYDGEVFLFAHNSMPLDYGYTLITKHTLDGVDIFALHGHLSKESIANKAISQRIKKGEVIAWIGDRDENGGWNPHLHFQLSYQEPEVCDMPGVVNSKKLEEALKIYPDPQLVLGKLY